MKKVVLILVLKWCSVFSKEVVSQKEPSQDLQSSNSGNVVYEYVAPVIEVPEIEPVNSQLNNYGYIPQNVPLLLQPQHAKIDLHSIIDRNPLLAALLLGASLGLSSKPAVPNHTELLPVNPYIALLLSQYGRYVPLHRAGKGVYAYTAANNFHNNKPFGSYKIYSDSK